MAATIDDWDERIAPITGAMAPDDLPAFAGVDDRLRPDGRPAPALRAELRHIASWRNAWTVLTVYLMIVANAAVALWIDSLLWWPVAVLFAGSLFARIYILHHEAAHALLFRNRTLNDLTMRWVLDLPALGSGEDTYRRVHAAHHRDEFGPREPDLGLYARYPITRASLRRKLVRDGSGQSAWKLLKGPLLGIFSAGRRARSARFLAGQAAVFALFWAVSGRWWLYLVLWLLPNVTVWRVINRLRAIAEHGGMTRSDDRRRTTHHVRQGLLARTFMVPFHTGWHLAHHVDAGIPWRNLPRLHDELEAAGYLDGVTIWPNYRGLWRALAAG